MISEETVMWQDNVITVSMTSAPSDLKYAMSFLSPFNISMV